MIELLRRLLSRRDFVIGLAVGALVMAVGGGVVLAASGGDEPPTSVASPGDDGEAGPDSLPTGELSPEATPSEDDEGAGPTAAPVPKDAPLPNVEQVKCPAATRTAEDAEGLEAALKEAQPGDTIQLAPGTYVGKFVTTNSGTKDQPIHLCGDASAILDGDGIKGGYVFHLNGAEYWRLVGFTVRNGQKGVMADGTRGSVIQGLTVEDIGDEAIHLRTFSSGNLVVGNTIRRTGQRRDKFGEGVYIGSAESNWCKHTQCQPDRSDRNIVRGNTMSEITAEGVDVKEGTTGGKVLDNVIDGAALTGADSWVDIKGNDYLIQGNRGQNSPEDGYQTHQIGDGGWGTNNVFRKNVAIVNGPGFGFHLAPVLGNKVTCDNTASGAGKGMTNTTCA